MESYWLDVDASKARELLAGGQTKRSQSRIAVDKYARDMAAGQFPPTHQGIALDCDGVLVDGGHRMMAVIQADQEVPGIVVHFWATRYDSPWVVLCAPGGPFHTFDIGRGRSTANVVSSLGFENSSSLSAIARRLIICAAGSPWSKSYSPSTNEILDTLAQCPDLGPTATWAHSSWKAPRALAPAPAGLCLWLLQHYPGPGDAQDAVAFMHQFSTGENLEPGNAVLSLRNRLMGTAGRQPILSSVGLGRTRGPELGIALTIIAWNRYIRREETTKLQLPNPLTDETFPKPIGLKTWDELRKAIEGVEQ